MQLDENLHISDITDDQVHTFPPGWPRLQNKLYLGVWAAPQMKQFVSNIHGPACSGVTEDSGHSRLWTWKGEPLEAPSSSTYVKNVALTLRLREPEDVVYEPDVLLTKCLVSEKHLTHPDESKTTSETMVYELHYWIAMNNHVFITGNTLLVSLRGIPCTHGQFSFSLWGLAAVFSLVDALHYGTHLINWIWNNSVKFPYYSG